MISMFCAVHGSCKTGLEKKSWFAPKMVLATRKDQLNKVSCCSFARPFHSVQGETMSCVDQLGEGSRSQRKFGRTSVVRKMK